MDWCVDTRMPGAVRLADADIGAHLARHALDPIVVELARPVVHEALAAQPAGVIWISLDWEDQLARLVARALPEGPLRGTPLGPGVTLAHENTAALLRDHGPRTSVTLDLGVARAPEGDLDPGPADAGTVLADRPLSLLGLVGSRMAGGGTFEEACAQAGATVAHAAAQDAAGRDSRGVAEAFIEAERRLGGDFHLVSATPTRFVLQNRCCPFGTSPPPGACRFTSALAGALAAESSGSAEVTLDERIALGDPQCRIVVDLASLSGRLTSHHYRWPPAGTDVIDDDDPAQDTRGFRVTLSLQLPRDRLSVPVTRHLVGAAMTEVGVVPEDAEAVQLALTEACANVIDHSGPGDAYEVAVTLGPSACHIRVVDVGRGFDHHALTPPEMAQVDAEHGRGVALMHALVDQVRFESEPERGTVVHLVKHLDFDDSVPARRLMLQSLGSDEP